MEREKLLEKIKEFRLLDDDFMNRVFDGDIPLTEFVLRIILDNPSIKVLETQTQKELKNLYGHSVRLDIHAVDENGIQMDIEIQRADKGADAKRARYNSSMLDVNTLVSGEEYNKLPETYIIFITENDVLGGSLPIYHADRIIRETGKTLNDGTHIIYVNASYQDDSPLGKLMHDFSCKNPNEMYYDEIAQKTRYFKEDEKGVAGMCKIMEELKEEGKAEGRAEGKILGTIETLKSMNFSDAEIIQHMQEKYNLTEEQVKKYLKEL